MTTQHTPTPWFNNDRMQGEMREKASEIATAITADEFNEGIMAFLAVAGLGQAVNAHDALIAALHASEAALNSIRNGVKPYIPIKYLNEVVLANKAALRLARGEG